MISPLLSVENVFNNLKNKYDLKNNSEALHKIAEIYFSNLDYQENN